jgi:general stress protein 26
MELNMGVDECIGICGLSCSDCEAYKVTQSGDNAARARLATEWSRDGFTLQPQEIQCQGCQKTSWKMTESCDIRKCAKEKGTDSCANCRRYYNKCDILNRHLERSPVSAENLKRKRAELEERDRDRTLKLVENAKTALLGSVDSSGSPQIKAMLNLKHDGIKTIWFCSNERSDRTAELRRNPKACVYYYEPDSFQGVMLEGDIEVRSDRDTKAMMWRDGFGWYYPKGIDDPDYVVLQFSARSGRYYPGVGFAIE